MNYQLGETIGQLKKAQEISTDRVQALARQTYSTHKRLLANEKAVADIKAEIDKARRYLKATAAVIAALLAWAANLIEGKGLDLVSEIIKQVFLAS